MMTPRSFITAAARRAPRAITDRYRVTPEAAGGFGLARARSLGPRGLLLSAKFLSPEGFIAPAQSASQPLPLANPFAISPMAQIPNGSSIAGGSPQGPVVGMQSSIALAKMK
jgi:hypothetical protein